MARSAYCRGCNKVKDRSEFPPGALEGQLGKRKCTECVRAR